MSSVRQTEASLTIEQAAEVPAGTGRFVGRSHDWLAIIVYAIGAAVTQIHAVAHIGSHIAGNVVGDPPQFMWAMWWWPHAILNLVNPFVSHAVWYPDTLDLASATTVPLPAVLMAPVTAVAGPVVAYNVLNLLAPVLGAWFMYRLCLRLTRSAAASIVGGWLFGFGTYGLVEMQSHLHLVFTFAPPAMLLLIARRLQGEMTARRYTALSAIVLIAQIGCSTEILFTMTVLGAVALGVGLIVAPPSGRRALAHLVPLLAGAYLIAGLVCAPYLYYAFTGPAFSTGIDHIYEADLLSFVVPTTATWLGGSRFSGVSGGFIAGAIETGTYVGLPGLVMLCGYGIESWRRSAVARILVLTCAVTGLLALGPFLSVDGHMTIDLPWKALHGLPGFGEALPVRLGLYVELAAALAAACWLAATARPAVGRWVVAALAVVFIFPSIDGKVVGTTYRTYDETYVPLPFFTDGIYRRYLHPGEVVLPIPFGMSGDSLLWQAQAHGYFRLASGWFGNWPHDYFFDPVVQEMVGALPYSDPVADMRSFIRRHHVGAVVMQDWKQGPWPQVMAQLGLQPVQVGWVTLYEVPVSMR